MLAYDKNIAKVWIIESEKFKPFSKYTMEFAKKLKAEKFDVAINLQPSFKIRLLVELAKIKTHFNYKKKSKLHCCSKLLGNC